MFKNGAPLFLQELFGANIRIDLQLGQDEANEIYLITKYDGMSRKVAEA